MYFFIPVGAVVVVKSRYFLRSSTDFRIPKSLGKVPEESHGCSSANQRSWGDGYKTSEFFANAKSVLPDPAAATFDKIEHMCYHVGEIDRDRDSAARTRGLPFYASRSRRTLTTKHTTCSPQGHSPHKTELEPTALIGQR